MVFKLGDTVHPMVKQTLEAKGWVEFDPAKHGEQDWNLHWKSSRFKYVATPSGCCFRCTISRIVLPCETTLA